MDNQARTRRGLLKSALAAGIGLTASVVGMKDASACVEEWICCKPNAGSPWLVRHVRCAGYTRCTWTGPAGSCNGAQEAPLCWSCPGNS